MALGILLLLPLLLWSVLTVWAKLVSVVRFCRGREGLGSVCLLVSQGGLLVSAGAEGVGLANLVKLTGVLKSLWAHGPLACGLVMQDFYLGIGLVAILCILKIKSSDSM